MQAQRGGDDEAGDQVRNTQLSRDNDPGGRVRERHTIRRQCMSCKHNTAVMMTKTITLGRKTPYRDDGAGDQVRNRQTLR
eukprot:505955-Pelagomonas_calceolata.AAC.4